MRTQCSTEFVVRNIGRSLADITTSSPLDASGWKRRLAENSLGAHPPKAPVYLYHGTSDSVIVYPQAEALREIYCAAGAGLTWATFPGDHQEALAYFGNAIQFLADRFAGLPKPGNC